MIELINSDYRMGERRLFDLAVYDPPFDEWDDVSNIVDAATTVCFTNFKNRKYIEKKFGEPKVELIWFFKDGRWVSHKLPRQTHEYILIYGEIKNECYTGDKNYLRQTRKGNGSVGRDSLEKRTYKPRERKMMESVIEIPRNVSLGVWSKPEKLVKMILNWLCNDGDYVWDGFAGSGTVGVVCSDLNLNYTGFEIDQKTFNNAMIRIQNKLAQTNLFA